MKKTIIPIWICRIAANSKDGLVKALLKLDKAINENAISANLKGLGKKDAIKLQALLFTRNAGWLCEIGLKSITLDAGSTIKSVCGNQEGAAKGFNTTKKGAKSYHPLMVFASEMKLLYQTWFRKVSAYTTNGMGLLASYAEKLVVEHNEIRYGKYMGMQIGNHHGDQLNGMRDNLIRYNYIHHIMKLYDDGGGIYTLSLQPGTRIVNNWLHDITRGKWAQDYPVAGIYQDNNSGYIWVQDNVLTDITNRFYEQCAGGAETRGNIYINNNRQDKDIKTLAGPRK
jgi:hypothetical protein